jgi:hypothetical protein
LSPVLRIEVFATFFGERVQPVAEIEQLAVDAGTV